MQNKTAIPIHDLSAKAQADLLIVRKFKVNKGDAEIAHRHNYNQLLFIENAKGKHEIDFISFPLKNYSFHFVAAGQVHKLLLNEKAVGGALLFQREVFSETAHEKNLLESLPFFNRVNYPVLETDKNNFEQFTSFIQHIFEEQNDDNNFIIKKNYLSILLLKLRQFYFQHAKEETTKTKSPQLVNQFLHLIEKNCLANNKVNWFADKLFVTPNHLNETSKNITGKTALELIQEQILLEAKRMIIYTTLSIKEIAFACGFDDVAYFSRFFKKHTAKTPQEFRKRFQ